LIFNWLQLEVRLVIMISVLNVGRHFRNVSRYFVFKPPPPRHLHLHLKWRFRKC